VYKVAQQRRKEAGAAQPKKLAAVPLPSKKWPRPLPLAPPKKRARGSHTLDCPSPAPLASSMEQHPLIMFVAAGGPTKIYVACKRRGIPVPTALLSFSWKLFGERPAGPWLAQHHHRSNSNTAPIKRAAYLA